MTAGLSLLLILLFQQERNNWGVIASVGLFLLAHLAAFLIAWGKITAQLSHTGKQLSEVQEGMVTHDTIRADLAEFKLEMMDMLDRKLDRRSQKRRTDPE